MLSEKLASALEILKVAELLVVILFVVIPLSATFGFLAVGSASGLLAIHILSGLVWFMLVVGSPVYCMLLVRDIIPKSAERLFTRNIPNFTVTAFGFGLATVVSGTMLFLNPSLTGSQTGVWRTIALGLAWVIFTIGLLGPNRYHIGEYREKTSGEGRESRIADLRKKNLMTGSIEGVLIISFVVFMNFVNF